MTMQFGVLPVKSKLIYGFQQISTVVLADP